MNSKEGWKNKDWWEERERIEKGKQKNWQKDMF